MKKTKKELLGLECDRKMRAKDKAVISLVNYLSKIYIIARPIPGSNRALKELRNWGMRKITSETEEGNIQLDILSAKPIFSTIDDIKYVFFENDLFSEILSEAEDNSVFCDVGGFHGFYSLINKSEKTQTFEMNDENFRKIEKNIDLNPEKNIELHKKAVWSEETKIGTSGDLGQSHIDGEGETEAITLDNFFSKRKDPDVIKIDVEGAEGHVITGAEKLLKRSSPTLFIEVHFGGRLESYDSSYNEIKEKLKNYGYSLKTIQNRSSAKIIKAEA